MVEGSTQSGGLAHRECSKRTEARNHFDRFGRMQDLLRAFQPSFPLVDDAVDPMGSVLGIERKLDILQRQSFRR